MTIRRTIETITIRVDPAMSIDDLIEAGKYGYVQRRKYLNADNFPVGIGDDVAGTVELTLIGFNAGLSTEAVEEEIDTAHFRSSRLRRLLHVGAQHGELQMRFPIVTLGDPWKDSHGRRYDPHLICTDYNRQLDLAPTLSGFSWNQRWRFLVEPK